MIDRLDGAWEGDSPAAPKETEEVPEEFENPSGLSTLDCDTTGPEKSEDCDLEVTAEVQDLFLGETMPGVGIGGYEGEEDGGA